MRFSDDGKKWTPYETWAATRVYTLPAGTGSKTIYAQLTDGSNTQMVTDTIYLIDGSVGTPILDPNPTVSPDPSLTATPSPIYSKLSAKAYLPVIKR